MPWVQRVMEGAGEKEREAATAVEQGASEGTVTSVTVRSHASGSSVTKTASCAGLCVESVDIAGSEECSRDGEESWGVHIVGGAWETEGRYQSASAA